ncbi:nucleotidyltransferase domain-containing protein [Sediminibacillus albus]|uniref:nucleotidyltransferase domain-containing protein n=1 Tax=Sediminibacillus albus TaxID=407036 RepID=UPI0026ADA18B
MEQTNRLPAKQAAERFIGKHFPDSKGAILAGSTVRGEATATSDLDIIIFDDDIASSFR